MGVKRFEIGRGDRRQAPMPAGPSAEVLFGDEANERLGAVHVVVPSGAALPAHEHGDSESLLISLAGRALLTDAAPGGATVELEPGAMARIPVGHPVELRNEENEPARLLAVFSPADFATRIREWPAADAVASR